MKIVTLILIIGCSYSLLWAQDPVKDSLWNVWTNENLSTDDRLDAIGAYTWDYYLFSQPDSGFYFARLEYEFAVLNHDTIYQAEALNTMGISHALRDNYDKAIKYYNKSLEKWQALDNKKGIAGIYNNLSIIYKSQGDYVEAIEILTKSLTIYEEIDDKDGMSNALNNIGNLYLDQEDLDNALDFHLQGLEICEDLGDEGSIAISQNNVGLIYKRMKVFDKALDYLGKSLEICERINDKVGLANVYNNIGNIHFLNKDYEQALDNCLKSLSLNNELGRKRGGSDALNNIGRIYLVQKEFYKAIEYGEQALVAAQEVGALIQINEAAFLLYEAYKSDKNKGMALEMHELYVETKDSIKSEKNQKEIIHQKFKYEFEKKKALEDAAHEAEMERKEILEVEKRKQQVLITVSISIGLILTLVFLLIIFRRLKITRVQKNEILSQKNTIEKILTDVTDSIDYAKRLQNAILPSDEEIGSRFPDSFIFYNPKDAVSGDFYWFETIRNTVNLNNATYLAVADCTGHGVPGAMVSVVCSNALNRTVFEYNITEPSEVLDKARELVISTFEKDGTILSDGMDIVLCMFNYNKLVYAGANNPLWITREASLLTEKEKESGNVIVDGDVALIELKANRQPVGKYAEMRPFNQEEVTLYKGDNLYFFTDGYIDQFGGDRGKKYMKKRFKKLLIKLQPLAMSKQYGVINKEFEEWKGEYNQIDDVCVIGLKIT